MEKSYDIVGHTRCTECNEEFSNENTFTPAGWRETQISGMCERCFDELFADVEEE